MPSFLISSTTLWAMPILARSATTAKSCEALSMSNGKKDSILRVPPMKHLSIGGSPGRISDAVPSKNLPSGTWDLDASTASGLISIPDLLPGHSNLISSRCPVGRSHKLRLFFPARGWPLSPLSSGPAFLPHSSGKPGPRV